MLNRYLLMVFLLTAWCSGWVWMGAVSAGEMDVIDIVKKHEDHWKGIDTIQIVYAKSYKEGDVLRSFPNCYWESEGDKTRSVMGTLKNDTEVFEDVFYDGKDSYKFIVPRSKYTPLNLTEVKLCDYTNLSEEGYRAIFTPGNMMSIGTDVRINFPLLRYFFVYTDKNWMTLLELVKKYPSKIVSTRKNVSGDELVEILLEDRSGEHEWAEPWKLKVLVNTSKGYNIEGYRLSTATKAKPPIKMISECMVEKYIKVKGGYWVPCNIKGTEHNGDPAVGVHVDYFINDCRINDTLKSRLNGFRFPINFPVLERAPADQSEKIHIWGAENKPIRTFDDHVAFSDVYFTECPMGVVTPRRDYFVLRIAMSILGLIMIAVTLYKLFYAKNQ